MNVPDTGSIIPGCFLSRSEKSDYLYDWGHFTSHKVHGKPYIWLNALASAPGTFTLRGRWENPVTNFCALIYFPIIFKQALRDKSIFLYRKINI